MKMDYLFTEKTKLIYDNLNVNGLHIDFEINPDLLDNNCNKWGMLPTFKILAPNDSVNKPAFTHELLHIQLFALGFVDSSSIRYMVDKNGVYFSGELLDKINNNLAHLRMLPTFQNLGFDKYKFMNKTPVKLYGDTLNRIKELPSETNKYLRLQKLICKYSTIRYFDFFDELDTKESIDILQKIDNKLYLVLEGAFTDWIKGNSNDNIKFFMDLKSEIEK